jgi:uncharacterized OB-fold protein
MTHEVFICHSSNDATIANTVCATLESKRIQCWIAPRDVLPGAIWGEAVANAIDASRIVVLIISINSCNSSQVLREVERAASNNKPILPLRIDTVAISGAIGFFVSSRHWLDAQTPPLKTHLLKLTDTVKRLLEQEQITQKSYNTPPSKPTIFPKEGTEAVKTTQQDITCPKCGAKLRPSASFCNKCGARISEDARGKTEDNVKREAEETLTAKEAREKAEKEAEEARIAKEEQEEAEREVKEAFRRAKEAQAKWEKEAEEARIAKEAHERVERDAEETRKAKEAQEKAERDAEEARKAQEAREKAEREAEEARKAQEAQEKAEREAEEARKAQEAQEKAEREAEAVKPYSQISHCPKCGNELRPGAGFCNKCGTHISQGEKAEDKEHLEKESPKPSPQVLYCPKCGYNLRPGAGFCDRCGVRIDEAERIRKARERAEREAEEARKTQEAREKAERETEAVKPSSQISHCPKCGYSLRPGAGFCDKCGARVSQGE